MTSRAWRIGFALCGVWIALVGAYGLMHAQAKAHRDEMFCYRMQAEAKAAPQCAAADAPLHDPLCRMRDATCTASLFDYPKDLVATAAIALLPPALLWVLLLVRRRLRGGAVG